MCKPKTPKIDTPPAVAEIPRTASREVSAAGDRERSRQRSARGRSSTILTGGRGATTPANTGIKTVLGS